MRTPAALGAVLLLLFAGPVQATPAAATSEVSRVNDLTTTDAALLQGRFARLLVFYRQAFHVDPLRQPRLVLTREPSRGDAYFEGAANPDGTVRIRFRGPRLDLADQEMRGAIMLFMARSLFDMWTVSAGEPHARGDWLREGAAEYYAWRALGRLWPEEAPLERNIQTALGGCMVFFGETPLGRPSHSHLGPSCGAVAQWLVETGVIAASGGRQDGFSFWADLSRHPHVGVAEFRAAAAARAPTTSPLLATLIDTGLDWSLLPARLDQAGADVEGAPPTPVSLRAAALRPIGRALCTTVLATGEQGVAQIYGQCGALGPSVDVLAADGVDPMAAPGDFYRHVRETCAARGRLSLSLHGEKGAAQRVIRCRPPMEFAPPEIHILRALPTGA